MLSIGFLKSYPTRPNIIHASVLTDSVSLQWSGMGTPNWHVTTFNIHLSKFWCPGRQSNHHKWLIFRKIWSCEKLLSYHRDTIRNSVGHVYPWHIHLISTDGYGNLCKWHARFLVGWRNNVASHFFLLFLGMVAWCIQLSWEEVHRKWETNVTSFVDYMLICTAANATF